MRSSSFRITPCCRGFPLWKTSVSRFRPRFRTGIARGRLNRPSVISKQWVSGNAVQKRPSQLSGGMRQRVAIARAFATDPRILFLDEPFSALDALTRATLQQVLAQLCSEVGNSATAIMITNNLDEALLLSDQIVPMTRGPERSWALPFRSSFRVHGLTPSFSMIRWPYGPERKLWSGSPSLFTQASAVLDQTCEDSQRRTAKAVEEQL